MIQNAKRLLVLTTEKEMMTKVVWPVYSLTAVGEGCVASLALKLGMSCLTQATCIVTGGAAAAGMEWYGIPALLHSP